MSIASGYFPEQTIAAGYFVKPSHDPAVFYTIWRTDSNIGGLTFTVSNYSFNAPLDPTVKAIQVQQADGVAIRIRIVRFNGIREDHTIELGDTRSFSVPDAKELLVRSSTTQYVSGDYLIVRS